MSPLFLSGMRVRYVLAQIWLLALALGMGVAFCLFPEYQWLAALSVFVLLVTLVRLGQFHLRILRQVEYLVVGANEAIGGHPYDEVPVLDQDDLGQVAMSINETTSKLLAKQQELQAVNQSLAKEIERRRQVEDQLRLSASVFTFSREAITITDTRGNIIDVNEAFTRITGYSREEVLGKNPRMLRSGRHDKAFYAAMWQQLKSQGHWAGEIWNQRKNGEMYPELLTISSVLDKEGKPMHYVGLFADISDQIAYQQALELSAHYDALTGLPNRILLGDRLHQAMAQVQRHHKSLAVAYLDLDGFKAINDNYGHDVGDRFLVALAERMQKALREIDTLARLGGDEFVAVLLDLEKDNYEPLLNRLLVAAAQAVLVDDLELQASASVGLTFYPQSEEVDPDQLLRQADQAMYQAKLAGKNRFHLFDSEQDRNLRGRYESLDRVRLAIEQDEMVLYYQPKVNLQTGECVGFEGLVRWQHPGQGLLRPHFFLPLIEEHALASALDEWVINAGLRQLDQWRQAGKHYQLSLNVSAYQLQQPDFLNRLRILLAQYPAVDPCQLELEVLETSTLHDLKQISQVICDCHRLGVDFALDDFGTGYASFNFLKQLPVSHLKIDSVFVRDMLNDSDDLTIVDAVLGLARAFRCKVTAEGMETVEHGRYLLQLGCELAQGNAIAHPMPVEDLAGWLAQWQPDSQWHAVRRVSRQNLPLLFALVEKRAWAQRVEGFLRDQRLIAPTFDQGKCRFEYWLENEDLQRFGKDAHCDELERQQLHLHALAAELMALKDRGRAEEALVRFPEFCQLRDSFFGRIQRVISDLK